MRKNYITWMCLVGCTLGALSCRKIIESWPLERETREFVFDSQDSLGVYAGAFLSNIYSRLPNGYARFGTRPGFEMLAAITDDAVPSDFNCDLHTVALGGITPTYNPDDNWAAMYAGIRQASIFINNIDVVPLQYKPDRHHWKAEARFLRAFFYFQLVMRYGGVPLMGDSVRGIADNVQIPRSSYTDCINYIVSECDAIRDSLRPDPVDAANWGRAGRGAAMALKARALLYAASPLNNPNNEAAPWKRAADAAKEIIDMQLFGLENDFISLFLTRPNREIIFSRNNGAEGREIENSNTPIGYEGEVVAAFGRTSPTQELVDAFGMNNGLPITEPASGYDPENPYLNRDPRFYATIFYNGALWLGRLVEVFEGGQDKPNSTLIQTATGYYCRKFMAKSEGPRSSSAHVSDFIYFRYAEILLNYAEALNEYSGPSTEVYRQLKALRQRAGIAPGTDEMYGLKPDMQQDEMRELIRNERRVELAFEEHRFWDIRRWKIAEDVYNQSLHGVKITVYPGTGELTYQEIAVIQPFFSEPGMYRYPIPYREIVKGDSLVQNDGW